MPIRELHLTTSSMNVVALAGGVGGARLADGLARAISPEHLTVIVNIGDDFEHMGLRICPDLDTVCYTLAGIANPETGWGRADETFHAMDSLALLGGPTWFRLGDRDLGLHLERTCRLLIGHPLSQVTYDFCKALGIRSKVFPVSDDLVPTIVLTEESELPFQEYFVRLGCQPRVKGFRFQNIEHAQPAPGVREALHRADLIIICPSNPWVSIDPILQIPGVKEAFGTHHVVAVSPIIGGKTVKGPAAKMYEEMGIEPSALAVARHYGSLISGFVIDTVDLRLAEAVQELDILPYVTNTIMNSTDDRRRLALEVLEFSRLA